MTRGTRGTTVAVAATFATAIALIATPSAAQRAGGGGHGGGSAGGAGGRGGAGGGGSAAGAAAVGANGRGDSFGQGESLTDLREEGGVTRGQGTAPRHFWEIGAGLETHGLLWQNNLGGNGDNRLFNYYFLYGHVDFGLYNRVSVYTGLYERFLADQGESGLRMDNTTLTYIRFVPLPWGLLFQARGTLAFPTSFEAQKMSLYLEPTIAAQIGRRFFRGLLQVDLRVFGSWYFVRYSTLEGGNPNPRARIGVLLAVEGAMPFWRPLSFGTNLYTAYYWYYDVHNGGDPNISVPMATADPQFSSQPLQQVYGGEIFARYTFPRFYGFAADVRLALAQGDTTLDYTSLVHDGVANLYLSYYQTSEIYGALTVRY